MNRPIFIVAVAFINGILIGIYLNKSIFLIFLLLFLCSSLLLLIYIICTKKESIIKKNEMVIKTVIIYLVTVVISSSYTCYKNADYNNKYKDQNKQILKVVGTVISETQERNYKYVYTIKVEEVNNSKKYKNDYLILNIKKDKDSTNKIKLDYADEIAIIGIYKEPEIARNYKGFNYKNYLKTKKIYGIIDVENSYNIKILRKNNLDISNLFIDKLANSIKIKLHKILGKKQADLAVGILIGHAEDIDFETVQTFKDSNLSHMLAVSGMHVGYLVLTIKKLLNKNKIGIKKQKIIIILFLIIFINLAKNTPSVFRASFTYILYVLASLLHKNPDVKNIIATAILITTIVNPFNIFNVGMQLSYAGTIGILMFYNSLSNSMVNKFKNTNIGKNKIKKESKVANKSKILNYIANNVILSSSANIYIIPIMIYRFNTLSLTFLISNIVASPIIGTAMILGIITIIVSFISINLAQIIGVWLNLILTLLIKAVSFLSKIPGAKIYVISPDIVFFVSIVAAIIIILYKKKIKTMIAILIFIIFTLEIINIYMPNGKLTVNFIDVGQGDSTLLITPSNKKILIDGGGNMFPEIYYVGEKTLLPYLLHKRIYKLDYIFISHFDADHVRRTI